MDVVTLFKQSTPLFTALGDPLRQNIILRLSERSYNVNELVDFLNLSQPAVSHHLKILSQAGLVAIERNGTRRIYTLTPYNGLDTLKELINAIELACPKDEK
jgi:ArsR family transcriptional regulator, arsenate/arsenite/antimonite-responsive transcriptional repressor